MVECFHVPVVGSFLKLRFYFELCECICLCFLILGHITFVLGGHTTEILRLVGSLSSAYSPRDYVIADSDTMSAKKIDSFEDARKRDSATEVCDYFYL